MFEIKWQKLDLWELEPRLKPLSATSRLKRENVAKTLFMIWEEHCVECAVPECYSYCSLYVARADGKCARFAYGIFPNQNFTGNFNFGADVRFRRWAKIEAAINNLSRPIGNIPHQTQELFSRAPGRFRDLTAKVLDGISNTNLDFDDFVLECYSPAPESFKLVLEYFIFTGANERKTIFRTSFQIKNGQNFFTVPFADFQIKDRVGHIYLYPENSEDEKRLVFTWLDFVKYQRDYNAKTAAAPPKSTELEQPAAKVKCVAWDLDNTLWTGILVETPDSNTLALAAGVLDLMKKLDERGIIQTIVSKNNYEDAWPVLERLGVQDYFIFPAINWGQKSENFKKVAEKINIGLDTFAFIDDSPFERKEVGSALPQVRVFSEKEMDSILTRPEFDVPVTEASKMRRHSYLAEMKRENIQASFEGSYEDFLKSCEMRLKIYPPKTDAQILRCWELIQRTNQLNLSNRRYEQSAFRALLQNPNVRGLAFECSDKFGEYGIVGFASVDLSSPEPTLLDYVLSCRVAQKRVEHAFFAWLAQYLAQQRKKELHIHLVISKKNKPLRQVFSDLPFETLSEKEEKVHMRLLLNKRIDTKDVVKIEVTDIT